MKRNIRTYGLLIFVLVVITAGYMSYPWHEKPVSDQLLADNITPSPQNATYIIDGESVTLQDGTSDVEVTPGSSTVVSTRYFGNEVMYDFNADGLMDSAFLLTQATGGSGLFFYLVVAIQNTDGYVGSNAVFLGDRIAPQGVRLGTANERTGVIEVTYVDRNEGEDFSVIPSQSVSRSFTFDPTTMQLGSVDGNTSDVSTTPQVPMALSQKSWQWIRTNFTDGRVFVPTEKDAFVMTFTDDGTMSATTDCNGVSGSYTAVGDSLVFGPLATTLMYCDGSEEGVFNELLGQVSTYTFTAAGELELGLKAGEGTMLLR
jgi:heat shock protein HslJ